MAVNEELINELADLCGIIPDYWDILGTHHWTSLQTKEAILRAMGISVDDEAMVRHEIALRRARPWNRLVEPVCILSNTAQPVEIPLYLPIAAESAYGLSIRWTILDEQNQSSQGMLSSNEMIPADQAVIDGQPYVKVLLRDYEVRAIGYYRVSIVCSHQEPIFPSGSLQLTGETLLVISPDACYLPVRLQDGRLWGVSAHLYALQSATNCGIGDLHDLQQLADAVSRHGGGFVGINPLHAIPNRAPFGISPYSPVSRMFKNYLYLSLEDIVDVSESASCQELMASDAWCKQRDRLRASDRIDYEAVADLKQQVLQLAFDHFYEHHYMAGSERAMAYRSFVAEQGESLTGYALFCAIFSVMQNQYGYVQWRQWPESYWDSSSDAVKEFRHTHEHLIHYFMYLQWLFDCQHASVAIYAQQRGMPVGLYHDLAVGSIGNGSDVWMWHNLFASGIDVGAPLDDFNPTGQNWGFPPLIPERLRESGYAFFIEVIRKNMRHAGAIRIDHALGLFRLFWIPQGKLPTEGAYVRCYAEELIRIIALESVRNKALVIAEDLGTFCDGMREMLQAFRMFSFRLLFFERYYPDLQFKSPDDYPEMAISAVTTHDLPTLAGFWVGRDIDFKEKLNLFPNPDRIAAYRKDRLLDRTRLIRALKQRGLLPPEYPEDPHDTPAMTTELSLAIYSYLAQSRSKLLNVMMDDAIGSMQQMNLPGTVDEYPNWLLKMTIPVEQFAELSWLEKFGEVCKNLGR